ncbi:MAG: helix-turn-helix domain-containing protein [Candidatus Limnocylindrales bacterium]
MDSSRLGSDLRLLRKRRAWTQSRLSAETGVSVSALSLIECGHGGRLTMATVGLVTAALGAHLSVRVYWQGEGLDRLRDARHAEIVRDPRSTFNQPGIWRRSGRPASRRSVPRVRSLRPP